MDRELVGQLRDTLRRYVRERLVPLERDVEQTSQVPDDVRRTMAEMGLNGISIPQQYGGLGLDLSTEIELAFELGWTSSAFRSVVSSNIGIGSQGLVIDGTEEQKQRYLPGLASGKLGSAFALTEPDSGSDAASLKTRAVRDGDRYILNGTKRYISNAVNADILTVMARTDPDNKGAGGVSAFIVDTDSPGLRFGKPDKKMGQHGTVTSDVIFEDVPVPAANLIGGVEGRGFKTAMKVLDRGRVHIAAICVATAERLIHDSLAYAAERTQFGKPIAEFQLVQAMLADCRTEAYAGRTMVRDAAERYDQGERITMEAACCKYFCSEMVGRVADHAVQIHGGAGYMEEYGIERFYRDVRVHRIYEGTSQIQQLVIAREMMRHRDD